MKKIVVLLTMVTVLVLGIGMTVKAAPSKDDYKISKEQYHVMEEEYLETVRDILLEKGCKNAGITLTYITDAEENRSYTVKIHHAKLERMEEQELTLLEARIQESGEKVLFAAVELKQL